MIITESESICFNLPKDVGNTWKHEIDFSIKQKKILDEYTIENESSWVLSKYMNHADLFLLVTKIRPKKLKINTLVFLFIYYT